MSCVHRQDGCGFGIDPCGGDHQHGIPGPGVRIKVARWCRRENSWSEPLRGQG